MLVNLNKRELLWKLKKIKFKLFENDLTNCKVAKNISIKVSSEESPGVGIKTLHPFRWAKINFRCFFNPKFRIHKLKNGKIEREDGKTLLYEEARQPSHDNFFYQSKTAKHFMSCRMSRHSIYGNGVSVQMGAGLILLCKPEQEIGLESVVDKFTRLLLD